MKTSYSGEFADELDFDDWDQIDTLVDGEPGIYLIPHGGYFKEMESLLKCLDHRKLESDGWIIYRIFDEEQLMMAVLKNERYINYVIYRVEE